MPIQSFCCHLCFIIYQDEAFLEDINMILNTGDVPNIYEADEKAEITEQVTVPYSGDLTELS